METQDPGPRPIAPLMGKKRTADENSKWTAYRQEVKKRNRQQFSRQALEQQRRCEALEKVDRLLDTLRSFQRHQSFLDFQRPWRKLDPYHDQRLQGLINATVSVLQDPDRADTAMVEALILDANNVLSALETLLETRHT